MQNQNQEQHERNHAVQLGVPVNLSSGIEFVHIFPDQWHLLTLPDYQRAPNRARVNQIARGIRDGYKPAPITLYEKGDGYFNIVDGGHRYMAYMDNKTRHGINDGILSLVYRKGSIEQNMTFIHENTKLRMNPTNIINANTESEVCRRIRALGDEDRLFEEFTIEEYPVKPLSLIKAGIILDHREDGEDLAIHTLAYMSVANAVKAFDASIEEKGDGIWDTLVKFIRCEEDLWGFSGRHLLNFGVLGFAYFLARNPKTFFTDEGLVIKSKRTHVSEKRGCIEYESDERSDFAKLMTLEARWNKAGDQLCINASRSPVAIGLEINVHFWKNRPKAQREWRPETTW